MGFRTRSRQLPIMPDPARVVTRSLTKLKSDGVPTQAALAMVCVACRNSIDQLHQVGIYDTWWLDAIWVNAGQRIRALNPPATTREEYVNGGYTPRGPGQGRAGQAGQQRPATHRARARIDYR